MAIPRAAFARRHEPPREGEAGLARLVFLAAAAAFAALGAVTAVWISRANVGDIFYFGSTSLWSAMDPAGFYIPDVILFFSPGPIEHDHHPGLTMTCAAALLARAIYAVVALVGEPDGYLEFWVRHRVLLNGLLAGLASLMLLACCQPLYRVLRHFMDRAAAYIGCTLFLASVPTLLYVSRFSPEPWMLYFALWSVHLSLRALDGNPAARGAALIGICTALAVLSKWLAAPLVALNCYALVRALPRDRRSLRNRLAAYGLSGALCAALLLSKVSLPHVIDGMRLQARGAPGIAATWALPHEQPFLLLNAIVFALGGLGLVLIDRGREDARTKLRALLATVLLMALLIVRRPSWHYLFTFYWLFPAAAAGGLSLLLVRRLRWRADLAAVAAGLLVLAACNLWAYPGMVATYARYRGYFGQRAALARHHPAWMPAPWEFALSGYEASRDPARVFPFYGHRLDATLQQQRRDEDATRRRPDR